MAMGDCSCPGTKKKIPWVGLDGEDNLCGTLEMPVGALELDGTVVIEKKRTQGVT